MAAVAAGARALVFIGFMGAGKSRAAAEAAAALGVQALDSDQLLEQRFGRTVAEEFAARGEQAFRAAEEELVCGLLERAAPDAVIALGGGAVLSARVQQALAAHVTVLLDVDFDTAWERVRPASPAKRRPLASDPQAFAALHASRRELYERLADAFLPAVGSKVALRALPALRMLALAPAGTRLLWASAASGEYPVFIGHGLLESEVWPLDRSHSRCFCVSDERVAELHAGRLQSIQHLIAIPAGEQNKTLHSAERVWRGLVAAGMTRADHVVGLGGGVVGDLAGFCAAAYQRGVPIVQVPTTLMAQVDSAYGGKTGVDLPDGKNFVGLYHQPAGVVVDPDTLATLPAPELAAGYVEVLKTALIAGGELWQRVAAGEPVDERMILACARTKLAVVEEDERDAGRRQVLNLGHTVGHAIETTTGYSRYRHGEAVGLGLLAALRLSGLEALREQVRELLLAHGLPVELQGAGTEEILAATTRDKKRVGAHVPFVLVRAPGAVDIGCEVSETELRASVAELAGT
ncbi:MAG TPA: bifunctional shikimate kinase/3-dehydroquinate synthase [Solirubrobacteraceae bacterium]|nr:bifunctional shikimate kinase/3-dehydroquinate synthase [Solirubrobacteraceae bacterium]